VIAQSPLACNHAPTILWYCSSGPIKNDKSTP
jgi:hypothetical protein